MHLFQAKEDEGTTSGKEADAEAQLQGLLQILGKERMEALLQKSAIMKVIFEMFMDQMEVLPVLCTWQLLSVGAITNNNCHHAHMMCVACVSLGFAMCMHVTCFSVKTAYTGSHVTTFILCAVNVYC